MQNLKLGNTMVDVTTGYKGIAINRTEFLNGNTQYSLQQPVRADGTYPDAIGVDHHMLDFVDVGVADRATESTFVSPIVLGNKVKCIVSGLTGIATMKTNYLNGCAAYLVTAVDRKVLGVGIDKFTEDWVDQTRLQVVDSGIADKYTKPPVASNGLAAGGPNTYGIPRG